jgi:hypothetical protein
MEQVRMRKTKKRKVGTQRTRTKGMKMIHINREEPLPEMLKIVDSRRPRWNATGTMKVQELRRLENDQKSPALPSHQWHGSTRYCNTKVDRNRRGRWKSVLMDTNTD